MESTSSSSGAFFLRNSSNVLNRPRAGERVLDRLLREKEEQRSKRPKRLPVTFKQNCSFMTQGMLEDASTVTTHASDKVENIQDHDFKSLLTQYGRSVIQSALDHTPEESQSLKDNIVTAKEKVLVRHKTVENELAIAEGQIRDLKNRNSNLERLKVEAEKAKDLKQTTIDDLEQQLEKQSERQKTTNDMLTKEIAKRKRLEAELEDLGKDRKRKRESVASIWEEAERVKLE